VTLVFNRLADVTALDLMFEVDERYVHARLMHGVAAVGSGLKNISRLYGGFAWRVDHFDDRSAGTPLQLWSPRKGLGQPSIVCAGAAAEELRSVLLSATRAWASAHRSVLHRLSGGLDSSIVHACLGHTQVPITAYTYYEPNTRSDARPWARAAARGAHCHHLEVALDPAAINLEVATQQPLVTEAIPTMSFYQRFVIEARLARETGATAVFSGDGGDAVFGSQSLDQAVGEHLRRHGPQPQTWRLARAVALQSHSSAWRVLLEAFLPTRTSVADSLMTQLVSPEVSNTNNNTHHTHPWLTDRKVKRIAPRLGQLLLAPLHALVHDACPLIIAPLYSQIVIELLLRIPSDVLFHGGRDRGLARTAFERDVPKPILDRVWKDRAPGFFERLISHNRQWLQHMLLEGELARAGWIDRDAAERALSAQTQLTSRVYPAEVMRHLDTELWLQRLRGRNGR